MRKYLTFLALFISIIGFSMDMKQDIKVESAVRKAAVAGLSAPDFAYPRDVVKQADSLLAVSKKKGDGIGVLEALMERAVANQSIDKDTRQKSIEDILAAAREEKDATVRSLMNLYAATLLNNFYLSDRWTFSRRELPLEPRPADMREWSGDMFIGMVDSLTNKALDEMTDRPVKELTRVLNFDNLSARYYPTEADFVCHKAIYGLGLDEKTVKRAEAEVMKRQRPGSPAYYMWTAQLMLRTVHGDDLRDKLMSLYDKADDKRTAAVMWYYITPLIYKDKDADRMLERLKAVEPEIKGTWLENVIANAEKGLLNAEARIRVPRLFAEGVASEITVNNCSNTGTLRLVCRRFLTPGQRDNYVRGKKSAPAATETKDYVLGMNSAVPADTTLKLELPKGYYAIEFQIPGVTLNSPHATAMCSNVYPVKVNETNAAGVALYESATGLPAKGATLEVRGNKGLSGKGTADKNGLVMMKVVNGNKLTVKYKGQTSEFSDFYVRHQKATESTTDNVTVSFTTNLGVYHPGDTIKWLGVASDKNGVREGLEAEVILRNADGNRDGSQKALTDGFGRMTGEFVIGKDVKTGRFRIEAGTRNVAGSCGFEVIDFKTRGIKVTDAVISPLEDGKNSCTLTGRVLTYSGFGVAGATIDVTLNMGDSVKNVTGLTGADGTYRIVAEYPENLKREQVRWGCSAEIQVTAPDGESVVTSQVFDALYPAKLNVAGQKASYDVAKPVEFDVKVTDPDGKNVESALTWKLTGDKNFVKEGKLASTGKVTLDLSGVTAGQYTLLIQPSDTTLAREVTAGLTLYDTNKKALPEKGLFWMPQSPATTDGNVEFTLGVAEPDTYISLVYLDAEGKMTVSGQKYDAGYTTIRIGTEGILSSDNRSSLKAVAVRNGVGQVESRSFKSAGQMKGLTLKLGSFRDKVFAGEQEKWSLTVADEKGKTQEYALALNVYDQRLDMFGQPASLNMNMSYYYGPDKYLELSNYSNLPRTYYLSGRIKYLEATSLYAPDWKYVWTGGGIMIRGNRRLLSKQTADAAEAGVVVMTEMNMKMAAPAASVEAEAVEEAEYDMADGLGANGVTTEESAAEGIDLSDVELRTGQIYSALWKPMLVTDKAGTAGIDFKVPNVNTTWRVAGTAWNKKGNTATIDTLMVSSKPIMVTVNAPRFLRTGDKAVVLATLMNATKDEQNVTVSLEATADSSETAFAREMKQVALGADGNMTLALEVNTLTASGADAIYVTVRASNGNFSDGERIMVPVLTSQSDVVESENFYMNTDETTYSVELPQSKGTNFSNELTFTENPMWTIVEALPEMTDADNLMPTSSSQAAGYFGAATALGLMKEHPELEIKFDRRKLEAVMKSTVDELRKLQAPDGGWMWGPWSERSNVWTTANVLDVLGTLKRAGYLKQDGALGEMIARACQYYDSKVRETDMTYAIVRTAFPEVKVSLNGQTVIDRTIQNILKNWKKYDVAIKAQAASALEFNGNKNMARTLIGSLDQFGTQTKNKGFEFKNVTSLQAYAWLLEAYSAVTPKSAHVDGLRQYLIVRKQATNWGNSVITSWVVEAMINSGTPWTKSAKGAEVSVDGKSVEKKADNRIGTFTMPVSGRTLTITKEAGTPSYGAVVTRYTAPMADVKAYSDGEIKVEKKLYVMRDGRWANVDSLKTGDRVKVQIAVNSSRPMSGVVVSDERPAAFEPVEQLSRRIFSDGLPAYRENRDSKTILYLDYVPKGVYLFEYEMFVNNAGQFSSGIATATCTEAPTLTAHSSGTVLNVGMAD